MELLDIRGLDGEKTGRRKDRAEVHRDGDVHGTSHVWLVRTRGNGYEVLLQKRSAQKESWPGCYDISSAGHIPAGGDFLPSAIRELREEIGVEAAPEELVFLGMMERDIRTQFRGVPFHDHEISAIYACHKPVDADRLKLQKEEVESVMWMDYTLCLLQMQNGSLRNCIYPDEFLLLGKYLSQNPDEKHDKEDGDEYTCHSLSHDLESD